MMIWFGITLLLVWVPFCVWASFDIPETMISFMLILLLWLLIGVISTASEEEEPETKTGWYEQVNDITDEETNWYGNVTVYPETDEAPEFICEDVIGTVEPVQICYTERYDKALGVTYRFKYRCETDILYPNYMNCEVY